MIDIRFETIKDEHMPIVMEIYNYYILNSTATFHAHVFDISEMKELLFFDTPKYKTFVIFADDEICGYVYLAQYRKREAYDRTAEVTVYLNPNYLGKGIGVLAVKHIEDFAKQKDIHVLIATICGENIKSICLFERSGYVKCAHYKEVGIKFGRLLDIVAYQKIL